MEKSSIFRAPSTVALVLSPSAIHYSEMSTALESKGIRTTLETDNNHSVILVLAEPKDVDLILEGGQSDFFDTLKEIVRSNKPIVFVMRGSMHTFGSIETMRKYNSEMRVLGGVNTTTLVYDSGVTYLDYASTGVKTLIERLDNNSYIQLHNMLLLDEGDVISKYEAL